MLSFRPSFVTGGTTSTSAVISVPPSIVNGDLIFCAFTRNGGAAVAVATPPSGWTQLIAATASPWLQLFYKVASSEPSSYTWTLAGTQNQNFVSFAYTGNSPQLDTHSTSVSTASATPLVTSAITAGKVGILFLVSCMSVTTSLNLGTPTGFTRRADFNTGSTTELGLWEIQQGTGTTGAISQTMATSGAAQGMLVQIYDAIPGINGLFFGSL